MSNQPPNILLIMTDQQRADFLAGQGFALDTMPFLESLRQRGAWFSSAYTPMPICIPARISLLTGRFPSAHGMIANWSPVTARYEQDLPGMLRGQGYELALFGKNHSHLTADRFDVWQLYDHTAGRHRPGREEQDAAFDRWMVAQGHWVTEEPTPFPLDYQYPVRIVSDTLDWLAGRGPGAPPFCAWVSFPEPHSPYQTPRPYFDLFPPDTVPAPVAGPEALARKNYQWQFQYRAIKQYHPECDTIWPRYRSNYCGMLRLIDDQLRRLLGWLEERSLLDNTIVLYVADHGEFCGDYGLYRKGMGLPQCTIRIPMFWYGGPIHSYPGYHPAHVSLVDVLPTLCEAVGAVVPAGVQGRSLWPMLLGEAYSEEEFDSIYTELGIGGQALGPDDGIGFGDKADTVYIDGVARTNFDGTQVAASGYRRAMVAGRWKLIYDPDLPLEIYDLQADPAELHNLADDEGIATVRAGLIERLLYWSIRLDDNLGMRRYRPKYPKHGWRR